jgi:hypothetical protein
MVRHLRLLVIAACAIAFVPAAAQAQASIAGTVADTSGAVLPGVTVEAASPALIEKVRTAVSDGTGRYRIENLRPGVYTVTFVLPGFTTVRREGIALSGDFVASVNAELRVGGLEETITVTGESPVVDVQSVGRQRVLDTETLDALPVNRMPTFVAALIPGVNVSTPDVGGAVGNVPTGAALTVHGSRTTDLQTLTNGVSVQALQTGSSPQGVANMSQYQEITVDVAAADATQPFGGVRTNLIPAEGGNVVRGSFLGSFASTRWQGSNFTSELQAAGLATPNKIRRIWDINPTIGGPVMRDRLWFFATFRHTGSWNYASLFANRNAENPSAWTYEADPNQRLHTEINATSVTGRATWQAAPKHKFNIGYEWNNVCTCNAVSATDTLEAADKTVFGPKNTLAVDWASPMTSRLLVDGAFLYFQLPRDGNAPGSSPLIRVNEQSNNLNYRGLVVGTEGLMTKYAYRLWLSYITGSHSFKVGFADVQGTSTRNNYLIGSPIEYRFNNGVPNRFTQYAEPSVGHVNLDHELGLFVQDKWTTGRMTLSAGVRFDYLQTSFPEMHLGPTLYTPTRNITTPETQGLSWKDITPRTGFAYDLFGTGKTAVKLSLNKYIAGQALGGARSGPLIGGPGATGLYGDQLVPTVRLVTNVARSWTDSNRNFVVDCNLTNQAAQNLSASGGDICGAGNLDFGTNIPGATYDPEVLGGWGNRGYNWELTAGVQQEILPGMSAEFSYFRRSYGNWPVIDNRAVTPADFTPFTITAPSHPDLPNGGGYPVTALNVVPEKFGLDQNYVTHSSNYGDQTEVWQGVDLTMNVRPRAGLMLGGGISTGRLLVDSCDVARHLPEMAPLTPLEFCRIEEPYLTNGKLIASYIVPRIAVQVSGTLQSLPGPALAANFVATNAVVSPSLGRPLAGGANNVTVVILQPSSMYGERRNQVDLRLAKVFNVDRARFTAGIDIANALNANPVLTYSNAFATWLRPQSILTARFIKFTIQTNF